MVSMRATFVTLAIAFSATAHPLRRQDAGDAGAGAAGGDPQTSLTLDPGVIATGFANDGQDQPSAGQVASLTSTNNFINFCLTVPEFPITNGQQIRSGSCNPAPMGVIPATTAMPSSKFVFPPNGATIEANTPFTIEMAIRNLETGNFVNAQQNYFSAPQQLNGQGLIRGHSHVVIELLGSLDQTTPTDPNVFAFFKGLNGAAQNGILTASVDRGLEPGAYRLASINTAANHQPCLVPIAQHGSLDDAVYFEVVAPGAAAPEENQAPEIPDPEPETPDVGAQDPIDPNTGAQTPAEPGVEDPDAAPDTGAEDPNPAPDAGAQDPNVTPDAGLDDPNANSDAGAEDPNANPDSGTESPDANAGAGVSGIGADAEAGQGQGADNENTGTDAAVPPPPPDAGNPGAGIPPVTPPATPPAGGNRGNGRNDNDRGNSRNRGNGRNNNGRGGNRNGNPSREGNNSNNGRGRSPSRNNSNGGRRF